VDSNSILLNLMKFPACFIQSSKHLGPLVEKHIFTFNFVLKVYIDIYDNKLLAITNTCTCGFIVSMKNQEKRDTVQHILFQFHLKKIQIVLFCVLF